MKLRVLCVYRALSDLFAVDNATAAVFARAWKTIDPPLFAQQHTDREIKARLRSRVGKRLSSQRERNFCEPIAWGEGGQGFRLALARDLPGLALPGWRRVADEVAAALTGGCGEDGVRIAVEGQILALRAILQDSDADVLV